VRPLIVLLAIVLLPSACSSNHLGLGESNCRPGLSDVSTSNILSVQAVPTAKYTPCLNELQLGWDQADSFAEDGRAGINITRSTPSSTFLTATVTESCDVSDAVAVESGYPDIDRFEDIEQQPVGIEITVVPSGEDPLSRAQQLVDELATVEIDNRPVTYTVDEAIDEPVGSRVERALSQNNYVLIVDEVDVENGTVQLSSNDAAATAHDLGPDEALSLVADLVPGVFYRGDWYFTFDGGCITYVFNTSGALAETIAEDAEDALGFFPANEIRCSARENGFDIDCVVYFFY
jgi:hypothetical protein